MHVKMYNVDPLLSPIDDWEDDALCVCVYARECDDKSIWIHCISMVYWRFFYYTHYSFVHLLLWVSK